MKRETAKLAEIWIVSIAQRPEVAEVAPDYFADLNVHFQRLLSFSERAPIRLRYDEEIRSILRDFTARLIIPLKMLRNQAPQASPPAPSVGVRTDLESADSGGLTAFLGHSFAPSDKQVVDFVRQTLGAIGVTVVTGQRPRADRISEKIKKLIDGQPLFIGLFTRRDKIAHKRAWTTSSWILDEKAYAVAKGKKLILLKEQGIDSIGGIQGDYEFIKFSRESLSDLTIALLSLFEVSTTGLAP